MACSTVEVVGGAIHHQKHLRRITISCEHNVVFRGGDIYRWPSRRRGCRLAILCDSLLRQQHGVNVCLALMTVSCRLRIHQPRGSVTVAIIDHLLFIDQLRRQTSRVYSLTLFVTQAA